MKRKICLCLVCSFVCCLVLSMGAAASSGSRSVPHDFGDGYEGNYSLSYDDKMASGSAVIYPTMDYARVTVTYHYGFGTERYRPSKSGEGSRGVTVVVRNDQLIGAEGLGAKGVYDMAAPNGNETTKSITLGNI